MKVIALLVVFIVAIFSVTTAASSVCTLAHSQIGHCRARVPAWSFDKRTKACVPFTYGGCGGNKNRFNSQAACERQCMNGPKGPQ
ncbi:PI-stichotoxin-Hcr2n-like [Stomoxys calcitrans]|uniref:BPTI/Kunitz inhibitor domain-containing protein n=1 Tax=Stomoxys calcitrans TaxID=35570 RepID=A0A1I8PYQ4_STOCA|nr:PI-stichotoxin-Hcr2n-like [Stomoxys calcitrans]